MIILNISLQEKNKYLIHIIKFTVILSLFQYIKPVKLYTKRINNNIIFIIIQEENTKKTIILFAFITGILFVTSCASVSSNPEVD